MIDVAAAAIVRQGRVLAARRTHPADVAGGWELPGGKVDAGESVADALVREVREELGCTVELVRTLKGRASIKPGYLLSAHQVRLVAGEPFPREHDALRWLGPEELADVGWLPSDRPFLAELGGILLTGKRLPGGNVAGAVRVGRSVRRTTGPWTPGVHALLGHLAAVELVGTPRVLGIDEQGREALTFLRGRVPDVDAELVPEQLLGEAMSWLRRYHDAVEGFSHPGPWRDGSGAPGPGQLICHHDFAPYNVVLAATPEGERLAGVFDWDLAAPGTRLDDLAFAAWNWVPLYRDLPVDRVARRLEVLCDGYGDGPRPHQVAAAVIARIERSIRVITDGQARGDEGMLSLGRVGEPARTREALDRLRVRMPAILDACRTR